jgi:inhibitor of KinA
MRLEALGDQAVLAYCDDEIAATRLTSRLRRGFPAWCIDVVQAYVSVAVFYDFLAIDFEQVCTWLTSLDHAANVDTDITGTLHRIPCCYEMGLDFDAIERHTGLKRDAVIDLHRGATFTVYAIGFCPGFPYLGYLPNELTGVPRLASPRLRVEQGSVGLTGRQTGIYTEVRPGGWNIIGRTPLELVNVKAGYFPLRTGDRVQFHAIDEREFDKLLGSRLHIQANPATKD